MDGCRVRDTCKSCLHCAAAGAAIAAASAAAPVARMPALAHPAGARIVIANAQPTPYDDVAAAIARGPLGAVLPALVDAVRAG